jgi:3-keto-5-aminohexanoate cleavage enzyme
VTTSIIMGGHARTGFEDNVYISKGVLATSNSQLVQKTVRIAELMGREIATPSEAAQILGL